MQSCGSVEAKDNNYFIKDHTMQSCGSVEFVVKNYFYRKPHDAIVR